MSINQPLSFYTNDKSLRFYLLNVGEGLMTLIIFPDNNVMLFDCNVTDENEDDIFQLLDRAIPQKFNVEKNVYEKPIEIFVNSHRDDDHCRGLKKINSKFPIKSIWDSGQTGATTQSAEYQYYMYLRRELKNKSEKNLYVPVPTNKPIKNIAGVNIYCLSAEADFVDSKVYEAATKIQHTNSIVLILSFGGRKLLLTGDSDWKCWRDSIIPNFGDFVKSDILVASHHGSRSFFTDEKVNDDIDEDKNPDSTYTESIKVINPVLTLIPCGEYKTQHHPNESALKLYKQNTSNEQVYTTCEKGHLTGFIDISGYFTVSPYRFHNRNSNIPSMSFQVICRKIVNGESIEVPNNSYVKTGCSLQFSIKSQGGVIDPYESLHVIWEVSNGGKDADKEHQEIYNKKKEENNDPLTFKRELSYKGTHLLSCIVINRKKGFFSTFIFVVTGI